MPRELFFAATIAAAISVSSLRADVTVQADQIVGTVTSGKAGVNTAVFWNTNAPNYRADLETAGIGMVRVAAYPDVNNLGGSLADLDRKVAQIINAGAEPLFIQYINSNPTADATFISKLLKLDGTAGGTIATNQVFLVNRYRQAPYNLAKQTWEVGNEPDINVDYQVATAQEYIDIFQAVHNQLVASNLRGNVVLCGPVTSWDHGFGGFRDTIMNAFLPACKNQVDVVTRHIYAEIYPWEPLTDTAENLLNTATETSHFDHTATNPQGARGEKALLNAMAAAGVPAAVGTGVTEMNLFKNVNEYRHTITQGLWFLLANHYSLYNPRSKLTVGFKFDQFNDLLAYYKPDKSRSYAYWSTYILRKLTGGQILAKSSSDSRLVVTGTKDSQYVYVQVINRGAVSLTTNVVVTGVSVGAPALYQLTSTATPDAGAGTGYGANFSYTFPAMTASVFRFPIVGAPQPPTVPPPPATVLLDTDFAAAPSGMLAYTGGYGTYVPNINGGALQLSSSSVAGASGAVVFNGQPLTASAQRVQARFGFTVNGSYDGFVFAAYSTNPAKAGNHGSSLGYYNQASYSWGVKVDNSPDEVAILGGAPTTTTVEGEATYPISTTYTDGRAMYMVIDYDGGEGTVRARLYEGTSDSGALRADVTNRLRIPASLAAGTVFGLTGATGSIGQTTRIEGMRITLDSGGFVIGQETIIDNTDSSKVTITGAWTTSTNPQDYGADFLHDGNAGKGSKSVRFTPNLSGAGHRDVYLWWVAGTNRANNIPVTVVYQGGSATVTISQLNYGAQWVKIGKWPFAAGTGGHVTIGTAGTTAYVTADAIKFTNVAP